MKETVHETVDAYLDSLPEGRRTALSALRDVIREHLPEGYEEGIQYGMIGYYVPLSRYPETYNGQALTLCSLASQKNHMAMYLMCVYGDPETDAWFKARWAKTGKRLDMGKSCVRFKRLGDVPLDVIGELIERTPVDSFIASYEAARAKAIASR